MHPERNVSLSGVRDLNGRLWFLRCSMILSAARPSNWWTKADPRSTLPAVRRSSAAW